MLTLSKPHTYRPGTQTKKSGRWSKEALKNWVSASKRDLWCESLAL